jgi:hypothetical protein
MLNFFLMFLRIRTIIILGIIYFFLSISSGGKFNFQLPDFKNINLPNLGSGLQNVKDQIMGAIATNQNTSTSSGTSTNANTSNSSNGTDGQNGNTQMAEKIKEIMKSGTKK